MSVVEIRMPEDEKEGTEAAVAAWLRSPGERVTQNEPLVEISTDKVTLEIASPASGMLDAITKNPGDTVNPGDVLGTIKTEQVDAPVATVMAGTQRPVGAAAVRRSGSAETIADRDGDRSTFSPVVRRLLAELNLDPDQIAKVARGRRLTPEDIRAHLAAPLVELQRPAATNGRLVPHTPMRKSIATHMAQSVQAAPHVTSVFEADLFHVLADRERRKKTSADAPVPSVTAYLIRAALEAIAAVPEVNSKWHDTQLEVFDHVNFGVGTALEAGGLVVPVIRNAQAMDLPAVSDHLRALTQKARAGKLSRDDMDGGTFTLSNHGVSGSLWAAPIILPHGQAAILGAGKLQKRVTVCETGGRELFRVRPMMYVTLTVDHRVLDGQQTNLFLTRFVAALEQPLCE